MREESSEQSGENIPLLSLLYFVFLGQRMQTRLPVSVSHLFSTRNIDERIGAFADRELTVCSSHFAMVTPFREILPSKWIDENAEHGKRVTRVRPRYPQC